MLPNNEDADLHMYVLYNTDIPVLYVQRTWQSVQCGNNFDIKFFPLYCLENGWSSVPCMTLMTGNLTIFSLGTSRQVLESDSTLCCTAQGETYRWSCLRLFSTWPHLLRHLYIHMNLAGGTVAWRGCGKYGSIRWTLQKVKHVFSCWLHGCTAYWTKSGLYCAKIVCSSVLCQNCPYMKISF
jgi:hypothetical protein